jgi:hypothetical protein
MKTYGPTGASLLYIEQCKVGKNQRNTYLVLKLAVNFGKKCRITHKPPNKKTKRRHSNCLRGRFNLTMTGIGRIQITKSKPALIPAVVLQYVNESQHFPGATGLQNFLTGEQMNIPAKMPYRKAIANST